MPLVQCAVPTCGSSNQRHSVKLFKFPFHEELRKKWLANCGLDEKFAYKYRKICDKHFEPTCLGKVLLYPGAIPTLYVPSKIYNYEPIIPKGNLASTKCCIEDCSQTKRSNISARFFKFPTKDLSLLNVWKRVCNIAQEVNVEKLFVCNRHFKTEDIANLRLSKDVVPSIFHSSTSVTSVSDSTISSDDDDVICMDIQTNKNGKLRRFCHFDFEIQLH